MRLTLPRAVGRGRGPSAAVPPAPARFSHIPLTTDGSSHAPTHRVLISRARRCRSSALGCKHVGGKCDCRANPSDAIMHRADHAVPGRPGGHRSRCRSEPGKPARAGENCPTPAASDWQDAAASGARARVPVPRRGLLVPRFATLAAAVPLRPPAASGAGSLDSTSRPDVPGVAASLRQLQEPLLAPHAAAWPVGGATRRYGAVRQQLPGLHVVRQRRLQDLVDHAGPSGPAARSGRPPPPAGSGCGPSSRRCR